MKKVYYLLLSLFLLFTMSCTVKADDYYCNKNTVEQMSKIVNSEVGTISITVDKDENTFSRLNVASIILNNASSKSGNTLYDKMLKFTDSNYQGYSSYRDFTFEQYVAYRKQKNGQTITDNDRGLLFYTSALILTGKYNVPKNIVLQAACSCFYGKNAPECAGIDENLPKCDNETRYGKLWSNVKTVKGFYDHYFGYSVGDSKLSSVDIYDRNIPDNSAEYFKKLALSLELTDYTKFSDSSTVCSVVSGITVEPREGSGDDSGGGNSSTCLHTIYVDTPVCENPEIIKVIYFAKIIFDIIKIVIPIGMIVMATIDFSKGVVGSKDEDNKKNLFRLIKRIIYAILIFAVPWIVRIVIINLGDLAKRVNYTDCLENATPERLDELQRNYDLMVEIAKEQSCNEEDDRDDDQGSGTGIKFDNVIITGDSRTDQMCRYNNNLDIKCDFENNNLNPYVDSNNYLYVAKGGQAYQWYCGTAVPGIKKIISDKGGKFVILSWFGVNGLGESTFYDDTSSCSYKVLANGDWKNHHIVLISVTPVDEDVIKNGTNYSFSYLNNTNIKNFNKKIKELADSTSNITYCDIYPIVEKDMKKYELDKDGLHYTSNGYKELYKLINEKCIKGISDNDNNDDDDDTTVEGIQKDYYAPIQTSKNYTFSSNTSTAGCGSTKAYHDISIGENIPIYAGVGGTVVYTQTYANIKGTDMLISYGNQAKLTSSDGTIEIIYAHLSKFAKNVTAEITETCPKKGSTPPCPASDYVKQVKTIATKKVKKGDIIGSTGNTGNSTGAHLHVEIKKNGVCVCDPFAAFGMINNRCN